MLEGEREEAEKNSGSLYLLVGVMIMLRLSVWLVVCGAYVAMRNQGRVITVASEAFWACSSGKQGLSRSYSTMESVMLIKMGVLVNFGSKKKAGCMLHENKREWRGAARQAWNYLDDTTRR